MTLRLKKRFFVILTVLTASLCVASVAQAAVDSSLEAQIERYIKSLRAQGKLRSYERTAWLVYDFKSGKQTVSINVDTPLQAASMIKPYLALAFFHRVAEGRIIYGPESRKHMEAMIQHSNNDSTNWVMKQVGGPSGVQSLLKHSYPNLCRHMSIVEYIPPGGRTYRNRASASDYSRFLHALWNGQLPHGKEILRTMALPGRDRLYTDAKRVPVGTQVFNKTGSTAMCCGDMGILSVKGKNGQRYPYIIIGIIESRVKSKSYGSWISFRADVIREVSNLVYTDMKKRHGL
ncbi:MAG: serine hydrolase [Verrucomicrobiales bacterium]|nr:serine hydrolase [Verrucomicrobiales bacterium]